jgi:hypothetical protein
VIKGVCELAFVLALEESELNEDSLDEIIKLDESEENERLGNVVQAVKIRVVNTTQGLKVFISKSSLSY